MIKALDTATQGLLQAERRAVTIAKNIIKTTSEASALTQAKSTQAKSTQAENGIPPINPKNAQAPNAGPRTSATLDTQNGFGNFLQQFADLRAEQRAFEASAKAFTVANESIGTLLDSTS